MKFTLTHAAVLCLATTIAAPAFAQNGGADTYKANCVVCHGADGTSNTPAGQVFKAASLKDPKIVAKSNDELLVMIKTGKDKMPSFKDRLTDDQIKAVITYIRTLQN